MALQRAPQPHEWLMAVVALPGSGDAGSVPLTVITCRKCGLTRTRVTPPNSEVQLDGTGHCPMR